LKKAAKEPAKRETLENAFGKQEKRASKWEGEERVGQEGGPPDVEQFLS